MTHPPFNLREAFLERQRVLASALGFGRSVGTHSPTVGDDAELKWRDMLKSTLPSRYGVSKAFVVDVDGGLSEQLDVVIHDRQYSPLLFDIGDACYIPAESVYAVFEVKQEVTREDLLYAGKKVDSVRRLRRTSTTIVHAGGSYSARPLPQIVGGLLALDCSWASGFGQPFRNCVEAWADGQRLDLGCALNQGAFALSWDENGGYGVETCDAGRALIWFVVKLLQQLQSMGTVPAMDYDEYLGTLG